MNRKVILKGECIGRVHVYGEETELVLTPKETALFANVATAWAAVQASATGQAAGGLGFREGSKARRVVAKRLRESMRDIAEIAKSLDEEGTDSGAAEGFRMPRSGSYASLSASAAAFAENAEPRKALFIERGLVATFVTDLTTLVTELGSTGSEREVGRAKRVGGTASLEIVCNDGMRAVRSLRSIMRVRLRNNPAELAAWTTAARVHHTPSAPVEEEEGAGSGGAGGSGTPTPGGGSGTLVV